jgi:hypothetical protein
MNNPGIPVDNFHQDVVEYRIEFLEIMMDILLPGLGRVIQFGLPGSMLKKFPAWLF